MTGFDYEKIFKSLQNIRKNSPLIAVACGVSKISMIENLSVSSKINGIFVSSATKLEDYNFLEKSTILIDLSFFIDKSSSEIKTALKSFSAYDFKILTIGQEIAFFKNPLKLLQLCFAIKPDIILYDYHSKDHDIESYVSRLRQGFFSKKNYTPVIGKIGFVGDEIIDKTSIHITGQENSIHHLICNPLVYGFYNAAFLQETDAKTATSSAMMVIRAASRRALSVTAGPASFLTVFLDSLHHLKREYLYPIRINQDILTPINPSSLAETTS